MSTGSRTVNPEKALERKSGVVPLFYTEPTFLLSFFWVFRSGFSGRPAWTAVLQLSQDSVAAVRQAGFSANFSSADRRASTPAGPDTNSQMSEP